MALNYHVKPEGAVSIFRDLGNQPGERMIIPSVQDAVKALTARFTAEELIAKRTDLRDQIVTQLRERLARHAIVVDEFSIVNFNFSKSFNARSLRERGKLAEHLWNIFAEHFQMHGERPLLLRIIFAAIELSESYPGASRLYDKVLHLEKYVCTADLLFLSFNKAALNYSISRRSTCLPSADRNSAILPHSEGLVSQIHTDHTRPTG